MIEMNSTSFYPLESPAIVMPLQIRGFETSLALPDRAEFVLPHSPSYPHRRTAAKSSLEPLGDIAVTVYREVGYVTNLCSSLISEFLCESCHFRNAGYFLRSLSPCR